MNQTQSDLQRPVSYLTQKHVRGRIARPQPKGLPLIQMGYNELPFGPTPRVKTAIETIGQRPNHYGAPTCDALRDALERQYEIDAEHIICGNGSEELLDVIARNFVRPGDDVVTSEFGYIQFELTTRRVGGRLIKAKESGHTTDIDALVRAVTPKTKLMFLANPNNPTGTAVEATDLERLANALPANVVLVLDLAYGEFAGFDYCNQVHALVDAHSNVVVTRTFSKAFGLAGLRCGWAHAPEWMLPGFYAARGMGSVNAMAQAASVAALQDLNVVQERVAATVSERDRTAAALAKLGLICLPSSANFLLARIDGYGPDHTEALVEYLFDEGGIVVNRTREAGLESFFRFSLSLPEHNDLLMSCVARFVEELS